MIRVITVLAIFLLFSFNSYGQKAKKKKEIREKMWRTNDVDFLVIEVPEQYKNESAVILAKSMEYEVSRQLYMNVLKENMYIHKRIKLMDEAAVNEYSELTFESSKYLTIGNQVEVMVGVKIIKPNGEEKEIDSDMAVEMEAKSGNRKEKYQKLAIPDLEPGDIVDYYHGIEVQFTQGNFERLLYVLAESYPILKQRVDINISNDCMMNVKSLNGAPELKRNFKNNNMYSLVMENVDKIDFEQKWLYQYRSIPTLNFQAYFPWTNKKSLQFYFRGEKGTIQSRIDEGKLVDYAGFIAGKKNKYIVEEYPLMKYHIAAKFGKELDKEKIVKEAYDYLREKKFVDNLEDHLLNSKSYTFGMTNYEFIYNMTRFLKAMKINHDLVLVTPRTLSDIKDLALESDVYLMLRVNTSKPFYMGRFDRSSQYNDIEYVFQGTNAYAINVSGSKKERTLQKIEIPGSTAKDNNDFVSIQVEIDGDNPEHLKVKRTVEYRGLNKFTEFENILTPYEYLDAYSKPGKPSTRKRSEANYQQKVSVRKEQDHKDREEILKSQIEQQFDSKIVSYNNFKLLQPGIWNHEPCLRYEDDFAVEGLSVVNGNDYIIDAGKFISKQVALEKKDMNRKYDVYSISPRSYNYNVTLKIPEGYIVKGLEKLNFSVANNSGSFISSAAIVDGKIIIMTEKIYNHNYTKAQDWHEMVAFLEAAYDFTLQKILLTKRPL